MNDHPQSPSSEESELQGLAALQDNFDSDESAGAYVTRFDSTGYHSLVTRIVTAASEAIDRPSDEMDDLSSVVDPEALNHLFEPEAPDIPRSDGRLTFPYHGLVVTVVADGRIIILPLDDEIGENHQ